MAKTTAATLKKKIKYNELDSSTNLTPGLTSELLKKPNRMQQAGRSVSAMTAVNSFLQTAR